MNFSTPALVASKKKLLAIAALAALCGTANAYTVSGSGVVGSQTFSVNSLSTAFTFDAFLQQTAGTFTSMSITGSSAAATSPFTGIYTLNPGTVFAAGSYTFSVVDTGTYNFQYSVTPVAAVPEPETYALFFAGLGAVGFLTRRRRNG